MCGNRILAPAGSRKQRNEKSEGKKKERKEGGKAAASRFFWVTYLSPLNVNSRFYADVAATSLNFKCNFS